MLKLYLDNCCYNRPFDDLTQKKIAEEAFVIDYTEWRSKLWEDLTLDEVLERAQKAQQKYSVPDGVEII